MTVITAQASSCTGVMHNSKMRLADDISMQPHLYRTLRKEGAHVPLAAQLGELNALGCR